MKNNIVFICFLIFGMILLPVFCLCNAAPSPCIQYDLTNKYNASLDLSNNGENQETIKSWWIEEGHVRYCESGNCEPEEGWRPNEIHGIFNHNEPLVAKNNGYTNLTNVTIIRHHEIVKIIPVLEPNETFSVRIEFYADTEIFTEQEVYANFYTIDYDSGSCWTFELNFFTLLFIIVGILFTSSGIFYAIRYKKTKKKIHLFISVITILLSVIILIIAFISGFVCYPS